MVLVPSKSTRLATVFTVELGCVDVVGNNREALESSPAIGLMAIFSTNLASVLKASRSIAGRSIGGVYQG